MRFELDKESSKKVLSDFRNMTAQLKTGDDLLSQGDVDGAIAQYRKTQMMWPSCDIHCRMGKAFLAKGAYNEALSEYKLGIGDSPFPDPKDALNLSIVLAHLGNSREAIVMYRVGLRLPIQPEQQKGGLGGNFIMGDYNSFQVRVASDNDNADLDVPFTPARFDLARFEAAARTGLGRAYYGWPAESLPQFDKAIALAPDFALAYLSKGEAYDLIKGKTEEKRQMYEKAALLGKGIIKTKAEDRLSRLPKRETFAAQ